MLNENIRNFSANSLIAFHPDSDIGSIKSAVSHVDVFHSTVGVRTDRKSAMSVVNGVFRNDDVFKLHFVIIVFAAAFHADSVVAHIDGAVVNKHVARAADVDSVRILSPFWIQYFQVIQNYAL
ncbi:hypothetical protein SDC9_192858 [bioreactor metagenome]|uniref:Uncharacterized protein n=1 Tax=bioreactor metagenome TaxID=1076179 RepID=A0A645I1W2_9ZZZZ